MGNKITVTGSNNGFIAGGNQSAQNMVVGNMIGSANNAVRNLGAGEQKAFLEEVLKLVQDNAGFPPGAVEATVEAVENIAKDPTAKNKMSLIGSLKALTTGVNLAEGLLEGIDHLVDAAGNLF